MACQVLFQIVQQIVYFYDQKIHQRWTSLSSAKKRVLSELRIKRQICPVTPMQHLSAHQQEQRGEWTGKESTVSLSAASKTSVQGFQASINDAKLVLPANSWERKWESFR